MYFIDPELGFTPTDAKKATNLLSRLDKKMVRFVIDKAGVDGMKAIRLDVLKGNLPAEKLYAGLGFTYLHTLKMFYEDTGWTDYELYEYKL